MLSPVFRANREVAILCNHQRSVPKAFEGQLSKLLEKMKEIENQRDDLKDVTSPPLRCAHRLRPRIRIRIRRIKHTNRRTYSVTPKLFQTSALTSPFVRE